MPIHRRQSFVIDVAVNRQTVPATKAFKGKTLGRETLKSYLAGHPKGHRCYAWSHDVPEEIITILDCRRGFTAERG